MNVEVVKTSDGEVKKSISRKTQVDNSVKQVFNVFKRNWPIVLLFTGLGAATAWFLRTDPFYVGKFEILVEPATADQILTDASVLLGGNNSGGLDYPTQLEILRSPVMLGSIAERITAEFPGSTPESIVSNLKRNLSIERVQAGVSRFDQTKIISVRYAGRARRETIKVLEVTAEKFLEYSLAERQNNIQAGVSFIDNQLPEIQGKISEIQANQQNIQRNNQLISPEQKGQELFLQNNQVKAQIRETESSIAELKKVLSNLSSEVGLSLEEVLLLAQLRTDNQFQSDTQNLQDLQSQLKEIDNTITVQSARFSEDSPMLNTLQERRSYLVDLIEEKKQNILSTYNLGIASNSNIFALRDETNNELMRQMVNTQNQIDVLESRLQSYQNTQGQIERELLAITEVIKQYSELQRQLLLTTNTLNQLTLEREKLSVAAAQQDRPWELISSPEIISHNIDGSPLESGLSEKKLAAGLLGGILLGMLLAYLLESLKNTYHKDADLLINFNYPILGRIPLPNLNLQEATNNNELSNGETSYYDLLNQPQALQASTALYTELYFKWKNESIKSLIICGVEPGDGQAFVAANLARVVADSGQKVLIVDANLNDPAIHKYFSLSNEKGLKDLLTYSLNEETIIQKTELNPNLSVLPGGNTSELNQINLSSNQIKYLMDSLAKKYDLVIYNSPLFLESPDVSFLANNTDGILMVVRLKSTSHSLVKQAFERINSFELPILGFVVTY
ncbi:polysaccharide biosynthesis tyrosine autokinase [Gloeocapsa sp. PCC 73106]|uniref:polysaccharide biosynthesis tyrosine autokinase n=1 Tax=Gloeocapsa sp. PCC 73106 TaxID=102232 RepID=UPI0002ACDDC7|nr:polysaccharide biosynthesis tyrosine autokinase [Gloeocapsa sp. PCC 73106]ELR97487.1 ATPase involved in chromosome partitioning [Gloeocapsa sp. PCC 73106]